MKTYTLFTLGSIASVATASSHFRVERRVHGSASLETRSPLPGTDASLGVFAAGKESLLQKRADVLQEIALVAKLAVPQVASPVVADAAVSETEEQKAAARATAAAAKKA